MCGIGALVGPGARLDAIAPLVAAQRHRGPDAEGAWAGPDGQVVLGHDRLSILDLSEAGRQPMTSPDGRYTLVLNGEIYNYLELREELPFDYRSRTDTEVVLAAWSRWGASCLRRFVGMFALLVWDGHERTLTAARDRFGVKPLLYGSRPDGLLAFASEVGGLHAAGVPETPDPVAWATYLARGTSDGGTRTFWEGVSSLPAGHVLTWKDSAVQVRRWYDLEEESARQDPGSTDEEILERYEALLVESVRLRFRSDVPVGINLSGGLDSSLLLGLVHAVQGSSSRVKAFTFATGDPAYDETPWVRKMLEGFSHPSYVSTLLPGEVPALAESLHAHIREPLGGIPTLAYATLFQKARAEGVVVVLDGQGMDEQFAGYDYYLAAGTGEAPLVQGSIGDPLRPGCLRPEFRALAEEPVRATPTGDPLRDLQVRDLLRTKIPRALRFNDRVSMRASVELREPFLDHRLVELALAQPASRKIRLGMGKWIPRVVASRLLPREIVNAPKRPVQTPQREWLRGPLRPWLEDSVEAALRGVAGAWLEPSEVRAALRHWEREGGDTSFYLWQWISLGLLLPAAGSRPGRAASLSPEGRAA